MHWYILFHFRTLSIIQHHYVDEMLKIKRKSENKVKDISVLNAQISLKITYLMRLIITT